MLMDTSFNLTLVNLTAQASTELTQAKLDALVAYLAQQIYGGYFFFPLGAVLVSMALGYLAYRDIGWFDPSLSPKDDPYFVTRMIFIAGLALLVCFTLLGLYYSPAWSHPVPELPLCRPTGP